MNSTKIISALISMIIILMTPAYAAQMDITQYSGTNEANGYAQSEDQITIKATATIYGNPTTAVAAKRIQAKHSGVIEKFQTCATFGQNTYKCEYTTAGLYAGTQTFTIELLDADGRVIETTQKTIVIDNLKPAIIEYDINPKKTSGTKVAINYKAEDYLRTTGDNACSGIKEVQFLLNNQKVIAETGQKEQCFKENTIEYTRQTTDYSKITLCAKAIDYVGQESDAVCREYEIDQKPPAVKEINVKDADGFDLTGIRSGIQLTGSVEAIVEGDNDDVATVTADLSSINPAMTGQLEADEHYGTSYIWRNIPITNPSACQITITATDNMGNTAVQTKQCSIPTDDSGPEPVKLETNYTDEDGTYLIGAKGKITLEIREAGAGLFRKNVYIDLSALGAQYSTDQRAEECHIKTLDVWECTWNVEPKVPDGIYTVKTRPTIRDDVENTAAITQQINIRVDRQPPTVQKIDYTAQHALAKYGDKVVKGDMVEFKIQTTGTHTAYANFTGIGGSYAPGTCAGNSTKTCTFTQTVFKSGPHNATLTFDFYDRANNVKKQTYPLIIYGTLDDLTPEYWNSTVTCSPSLIDRSTTSQKEQEIYCHIQLTSSNQDAKPVYTYVDRSMGECSGNISGIAEINMMNNGMNSKDPYLVITLSQADFAINDMSFSCPIYVSTRVGNFFSKADEKEIINVKLEFYDLTIGEIYDNTEKNINKAIQDSMKSMKWVSDVEKYTEMARTICGWKNTFAGILSAFDGVLALFGPLESSLYATGQRNKAGELDQFRKAMCNDAKGPVEKFLFGEGKESSIIGKVGEIKGVGKEVRTGAKGLEQVWQLAEMFCDFLNCKLTWDDERYKELKEAGWAGQGAGGFLVGGGGGGAAPAICKGAKELTEAVQIPGFTGEYTQLQKTLNKPGDPAPQQMTNVKESLIWSAVCMCGPGISYNINKIRQINCKYALCLAEDVKGKGYDPAWCNAEKSYLTCTYVMGEIFSILPIVALYDKVAGTIREWFENPISIIGAVSGCLCGGCKELGINPFCEEGTKMEPLTQALGYITCILPKTAAKVMDAVASIQSMPTADEFKLGTTYCDQAERSPSIQAVMR